MSPLLQGRVAVEANRQWLERVWYLAWLPDTRDTTEFIATLAKALNVHAYVVKERAPIGQLYILRKGMCVKNWNFLRSGRVWGDDIIIDALHLMDHSQAVALTYMEVFVMTREDLDAAAEAFTEAQAILDHAARHIRLQRALIVYFCEQMSSKPRSFIRPTDANCYVYVANQMSVEQKVNALHSAFVDSGELRIMSHARLTEHGGGGGGGGAGSDDGGEPQLRPRSLSAMRRRPGPRPTAHPTSMTDSAPDSAGSQRVLDNLLEGSVQAHGNAALIATTAGAATKGGGWWGNNSDGSASQMAHLTAEVQRIDATVQKLAQSQTALLGKLDLYFLNQQGAGFSFQRESCMRSAPSLSEPRRV